MITTEQDRQDRQGRAHGRRGEQDERELRRLARTDMLNLHSDFAYWNPPDPEPPDFDTSPPPPSSAGEQ